MDFKNGRVWSGCQEGGNQFYEGADVLPGGGELGDPLSGRVEGDAEAAERPKKERWEKENP